MGVEASTVPSKPQAHWKSAKGSGLEETLVWVGSSSATICWSSMSLLSCGPAEAGTGESIAKEEKDERRVKPVAGDSLKMSLGEVISDKFRLSEVLIRVSFRS